MLESFDVTLEEVRGQVARIVGQGDEVTTGQIPFTPRAKKVLELGLQEALSLGHNYIGTEHLLLGLAREREGVAARILLDFDVDADAIRNGVLQALSGEPTGHKPPVELPPALAEEVAKVTREKEQAIEEHEFDRAAALRDRERKLTRYARDGNTEAFWAEAHKPLPVPPPVHIRPYRRMPRRVADYAPPPRPWLPFLLGWLSFGVAAGIGLLVGWLIWG